jgi:hypothetical protein
LAGIFTKCGRFQLTALGLEQSDGIKLREFPSGDEDSFMSFGWLPPVIDFETRAGESKPGLAGSIRTQHRERFRQEGGVLALEIDAGLEDEVAQPLRARLGSRREIPRFDLAV